MEKENKNQLIKKPHFLTKFDPSKKKGLIARGLKEASVCKTILLVQEEQLAKEIKEKFHAELNNKIKIVDRTGVYGF